MAKKTNKLILASLDTKRTFLQNNLELVSNLQVSIMWRKTEKAELLPSYPQWWTGRTWRTSGCCRSSPCRTCAPSPPHSVPSPPGPRAPGPRSRGTVKLSFKQLQAWAWKSWPGSSSCPTRGLWTPQSPGASRCPGSRGPGRRWRGTCGTAASDHGYY